MVRLLAGLIFLLLCINAATAQDALVVSNCGTLPQAYAVGSTRQLTVDTSGRLCSTQSQQAFNVQSYGAKCDGITDDTTAIQAAVTAWKASAVGLDGLNVLTGPGQSQICRVTAPLDFTSTSATSSFSALVQNLYIKGAFNYTGPVGTVSITNGGNYTAGGGNATYNNVPLTGGAGSGCTAASITVTANVVTAVVLSAPGCGTGYDAGNTLSAATANLGGAGAGGLVLTVDTLSGGAIVDAVGSRFVQWDNVTIEGDCTSVPNANLAIGRYNGVAADYQWFKNLKLLGCWKTTAWYNGASESLVANGLLIFTSRATGAYYGAIQDGMNHFNWVSTFKTYTMAIDTALSFNANLFNSLNILTASNAAATPLWFGKVAGHKFNGSYAAGVGTCGAIWYSAGASTRSLQLEFDMHFETTAMVNTFCLKGEVNFAIVDFIYKDYSSQVTGNIFKQDANITNPNGWGIDIRIALMNAGATVYNTPLNWTVAPVRIEVPVAGNYVAPGTSRAGGWICIAGAACTAS